MQKEYTTCQASQLLTKQKLFDLTKCLVESFGLAVDDATAAESIQFEIMQYFDPSHQVVVPNKFSVLFEGCKNLVIDKIRGEIIASGEKELETSASASEMRERELKNKISALEAHISTLSEENQSMIERHDVLKISNQSLASRLDSISSENAIIMEENKSLKQDLESLTLKLNRDAETIASQFNSFRKSVHSFIQACTSHFSLPMDVVEVLALAAEEAMTSGGEYDSKESGLLACLKDMSDRQTTQILSEIKTKHDLEMKKILNEIDSKTVALEQLQRDVQLKDTTMQCTQRDKERFQKNLEESQSRCTKAESELAEARKVSASTDRKFKKLQGSLKELEHQHVKILSEKEAVERDHQSLLSQYQHCRTELELSKSSQGIGLMDEAIFVKLQTAVEEKNKLLERVDIEYRTLLANFSALQTETRSLHEALVSMEVEKCNTNQELENFIERSNEQEREIEDLRMQEEFLRSRLSIFESQSTGDCGGDVGGNSLLSEVEDRRLESEKRFSQLFVNQRKMHKEIQQLKKEKKDLKNQLALVDSNSKGMSESQLKAQLLEMSKLISGFKQQRTNESCTAEDSVGGGEYDAETYDLLKLELHEKILELEVLRNENRNLRIMSLNEMSKVRTAEYSLVQHGKKVQQAESTIMLLKDKLSAKEDPELDVEDVEMENAEESTDDAQPSVQNTQHNKENNNIFGPVSVSHQKSGIINGSIQKTGVVNNRREKAKQVCIKNDGAKDASECKQQ
ncbi:hypothetical protein BDR26DRAFT_579695 [Obelidium mucronatum]|nr:hypothetical protein BDR26DRAFT_579695 [Obelidium mucronatum]